MKDAKTSKSSMSLLNKRSYGVIIVEGILSNYNGDPDEDNAPRTLPDGTGLITPVCAKHRIRKILEDHQAPIWEHVKEKFDLNEENYHVWESRLKGYNASSPKEAKEKFWSKLFKEKKEEGLIDRFWDMRVFGTCSLETKGDNSMNFTRTGCVSVSPFVSLAPVEIISKTITKGNPLRPELMEKDQGDIAPFAFKVARHALFIGSYVINPSKAKDTKTTQKDIELFKYLLPHFFNLHTSACCSGLDAVQIIHAEHNIPLCSFNESNFYRFCRPEVKDKVTTVNGSKSIDDYVFKTEEEIREKFPNVKFEMLKDVSV